MFDKNVQVESYNDKYGDPRPSMRRWRAPADRPHAERQVRSHPQAAKTNELVSCFCQKLTDSKACMVIHVTCMRVCAIF